jgi:hypothetical protein
VLNTIKIDHHKHIYPAGAEDDGATDTSELTNSIGREARKEDSWD